MKAEKETIFKQLQRTLAVAGISFIIVFGYSMIALNVSFLDPISETLKNFSITDKYYQIIPESKNRYIVIVDMSPLNGRKEIAQVLEEIEECNPKVIGLDCVFEKEKEDTLADNTLRRIARDYQNIIYAYKVLDEKNEDIGHTRSVHSFFVDDIPVHEAVANMPRIDLYSGVKRSLKSGWTLNGQKKPSFVGELVNTYLEENLTSETDNDVRINFARTEFTVIEPDEISENSQKIEGQLVLFGCMTDESDMHYTPTGKMPGVKLIAYACQTLIEGRQIRDFPMWLQVIFSILLVMFTNKLQLMYLAWTERSKSPIVHHVMGSAYVLGLVTFIWIMVVMWAPFLMFSLYNFRIEVGWPIAAMAFLATSRSFYAACADYYHLWMERRKYENRTPH